MKTPAITDDRLLFFHQLCLNHKLPHPVCSGCVDACPFGALQQQGSSIEIDHDRCTLCGACVAACPVLAVNLRQHPYAGISGHITEKPYFALGCFRQSAGQEHIRIPCARVVDIALLGHRAIEQPDESASMQILTADCTRCPCNGDGGLPSHISSLQEESAFWRIPVDIELQQVSSKDRTGKGAPPSSGSGLSRRSLLRFFRSGEPHIASSAPANSAPDTCESSCHKRQLLLAYLSRTPFPLSSATVLPGHSFGQIHMERGGECTLCEVCTRLCPTRALYWLDSENQRSLRFDPTLCIACKRCTLCPGKLLTLQSITCGEFFSGTRDLCQFATAACESCDDLFVKNPETNGLLCPVCQTMAKNQQRLLADLKNCSDTQ
ncbi:hypothetical protein Selin_2179 [Desulfurispirillum indicum S5]|uniref:4Fe-4S ferredoxin-type domain-containing protein n=1 Tax=Desulfurispirillum indicum (strain ATCC BAA-1389 / DSM 22839 / S5) TaxID=653733 RepID=E6W3L8_DESIS|nr:4Fe-4S binding protein [Desulfurispirillum indicum]ADU66899.1 hypothetical protein Selin_2179 [Desulfurispirillum indicum S5]